MIGISRRILDAMLRSNTVNLTHDILTTFMAEVCAIINSRPIASISYDPDAPHVISPMQLLTQKTGADPMPCVPDIDSRSMYKASWKQVQALAKTFWKRWRDGYLSSLQTRQKWQVPVPNVKEGDIILLKDRDVHRNDWPLGRVIRAFQKDDQVRSVELLTVKDGAQVIYTRPINELVVLLSDN